MNQAQPSRPRANRSSGAGPKLGLIGCGHVARTIYAPILARMAAGLQVLALCDLDRDAAEGSRVTGFRRARVHTGVEAFLAAEKLDAVLVLTSEDASAGVSRQVLASGVPVYAPCLRHFLDTLGRGELRNSSHRLRHCMHTIATLEEMRRVNPTT